MTPFQRFGLSAVVSQTPVKAWVESLALIVGDHTSESTFLISNWAKGNIDTFKMKTR